GRADREGDRGVIGDGRGVDRAADRGQTREGAGQGGLVGPVAVVGDAGQQAEVGGQGDRVTAGDQVVAVLVPELDGDQAAAVDRGARGRGADERRRGAGRADREG